MTSPANGLFILPIFGKKYEIVACIIYGVIWKSYQTKNAPIEEIRMWIDER